MSSIEEAEKNRREPEAEALGREQRVEISVEDWQMTLEWAFKLENPATGHLAVLRSYVEWLRSSARARQAILEEDDDLSTAV